MLPWKYVIRLPILIDIQEKHMKPLLSVNILK